MFETHEIAFSPLLANEDVMIDLSPHLKSDKVLTNLKKTRTIQLYFPTTKEGKCLIQNNTWIHGLSCSFCILKFSVHHVFSILIAISFYSFGSSSGN